MHFHFRSRDAGRRRRRPALVATALATAASLVTAAPALAGTFTVDYTKGSIAYQALPGETNEVALVPWNNKVKLQDKALLSVGFIELGSLNCILTQPNKYECPIAGVTKATIALADGADSFGPITPGGIVADYHTTVSGGSGGKTVTTGAGDDHIYLRNGGADTITCGGGTDYVLADGTGDAIAADCEIIDGVDARGGALPPSPSGGLPGSGSGGADASGGDAADTGGASGSGGQTLAGALGLSVPAHTVDVPQRDTAVVPLGCAVTAVAGCQGEVIIELAGAGRSRGDRVIAARGRHTLAQRKRNRRIGRREFKLAAGESVKLPVRITLRGHYALASKRRRRARATLKVVQRDAAGKVLSVQTRTVTLRLLKRKWGRRLRGGR